MESVQGGTRLSVEVENPEQTPPWKPAAPGESISVSGVCLTVVESAGRTLAFDVVPETLRVTTLGGFTVGESVNIESSLAIGDLLGGHLVTGHVDGVGTLLDRQPEGSQETFRIATEARLIDEMLPKGSITVDGVSLTLVEVNREAGWFSFAAIPHTLEITTLGQRREGEPVNLETDAIGKWVLHGLREIFSSRPDWIQRDTDTPKA